MNLRDVLTFGRRAERAGHPASVQDTEERIVTLGWVCMVATLVAAVLLAAYAAL
jgi:hypothetical protein